LKTNHLATLHPIESLKHKKWKSLHTILESDTKPTKSFFFWGAESKQKSVGPKNFSTNIFFPPKVSRACRTNNSKENYNFKLSRWNLPQTESGWILGPGLA
jgi:hypothetical protein